MRLGCNTVLFAGVSLEAALDHIAFAGYERVELAAIKGMCEHVSPDAGSEAATRARQAVEDRGLVATAMEAATTDRSRLESVFELAGELDVPIVNVGSGGTSGDEESTKRAIENIGDLAALAGRAGLRLAVKPHVGQAIYNGATALRLMNEIDEPALGLNFDPSHLFRADENPEDIVPVWGNRIITSHFRDCASREQRVGPPETQVPGRGIVDIPATLRALKKIEFTGPVNLEVIGAKDYELARAMGIAAETRGYLRRCLQELEA